MHAGTPDEADAGRALPHVPSAWEHVSAPAAAVESGGEHSAGGIATGQAPLAKAAPHVPEVDAARGWLPPAPADAGNGGGDSDGVVRAFDDDADADKAERGGEPAGHAAAGGGAAVAVAAEVAPPSAAAAPAAAAATTPTDTSGAAGSRPLGAAGVVAYLLVTLLLPLALWSAYDLTAVATVIEQAVGAMPTHTLATAVAFAMVARAAASSVLPAPTKPRQAARARAEAVRKRYPCCHIRPMRFLAADTVALLVLAIAYAALAVVEDEKLAADLRLHASLSRPVPEAPTMTPCTVMEFESLGGMCDAHFVGALSPIMGNMTLFEYGDWLRKVRVVFGTLSRIVVGVIGMDLTAQEVDECVDIVITPAVCSVSRLRCDTDCNVAPSCRDMCVNVKSGCAFIGPALSFLAAPFMRETIRAGLPEPEITMELLDLMRVCDSPGEDTGLWTDDPTCTGPGGGADDVKDGFGADADPHGRCNAEDHAQRVREHDALVAANDGSAGEVDIVAPWVVRRHTLRAAFALLAATLPLCAYVLLRLRSRRRTQRSLASVSAASLSASVSTASASGIQLTEKTPRAATTGSDGAASPAMELPPTGSEAASAASAAGAADGTGTAPSAAPATATVKVAAARAATHGYRDATVSDGRRRNAERTASGRGDSMLPDGGAQVPMPTLFRVLGPRNFALALIICCNALLLLQMGLRVETASRTLETAGGREVAAPEVNSGLVAITVVVLLAAVATLEAAALIVASWRPVYEEGVRRYRFGVHRLRRQDIVDPDADTLHRIATAFVAARQWYKARLGLGGRYFRVRLFVFEVVEVVTQLAGVLDRSERVPNIIVMITLAAVTSNVIVAVLIQRLPGVPHREHFSIIAELSFDLFYAAFGFFVTFSPRDMNLLQAISIVLPVGLTVLTLVELNAAAVYEVAAAHCRAANVPPSFTSLGSARDANGPTGASLAERGSHGGGSRIGSFWGGGFGSKRHQSRKIADSSGSRDHILRSAPSRGSLRAQVVVARLRMLRRVVVGVGLVVCLALTISAGVRLAAKEAACAEEAGALWEGVSSSDKRFFAHGFFAPLDCHHSIVQALDLRHTKAPLDVIDDRVAWFTGVTTIDARGVSSLASVSGAVATLPLLEELLLDGTNAGREFHWSGAGVTVLPEAALATQTALEVLDVSQNSLASLPAAVAALPNLLRLNVSGNHLTSLPDALGESASLRVLDATGNRIGPALSPQLLQLVGRLSELHVASNELESIPVEFAELGFAEGALSFDDNPVTVIDWPTGFVYDVPPSLWRLPLESLTIRFNHLWQVPDAVARLAPTLVHLNFGWNDIEDSANVSPEIARLERVTSFRIGNNLLAPVTGPDAGVLPQVVLSLTQVHHLWLDCMRTVTLPATVWDVVGLQTLGLRNNDITELPQPSPSGPAGGRLPPLVAVDISHNKRLGTADIELLLTANETLRVLVVTATAATATAGDRAATAALVESRSVMTCETVTSSSATDLGGTTEGLECVAAGEDPVAYFEHLRDVTMCLSGLSGGVR